MLSVDTEVTGVDLYHGAMPYFVTTCDEDEEQQCWEWDVDPLTREPEVPDKDVYEIIDLLELNEEDSTQELVFQNPKFDIRVLSLLIDFDWPWDRTRDTLFAGHLIASNQPHDLTSMALVYLGVNIKPYEDAVEQATQECRRKCRSKYPDWRIAKADLPEMPSVKSSKKEARLWKQDMWLPRAIAQEENLPDDHHYWHVLEEYANADSAATLPLMRVFLDKIKERGLENIYEERLKLLPIVYDMEWTGIAGNKKREREQRKEFERVAAENHAECVKLSGGLIETLPKNGRSKALEKVVFDKFKLPSTHKTKTGGRSMDKHQVEEWLGTLDPGTKPHTFLDRLVKYRKRRTALAYMDGYQRFALPSKPGHFLLHPSLNPTGTHTLRWSSSNPNEQNISGQDEINLRLIFGPLPGREWWSLDYNNLELRIPAYECEEPAMLELFEKPNDPPYFGSYHLLIFSILHPDKYDHDDPLGLVKAKNEHAYWYHRVKCGNFADLYGATEQSGTADKAFRIKGAQRIVSNRLKEKTKLNKKWIDYATEHGYIETMPDKKVDPDVGYPLLCTRSAWGKILPTVPLNYRVQGTACWIMMRAMIEINEYFRKYKPKFKMVMNVHDEVVLDCPKGDNTKTINKVKSIMEDIGNDLVPRVKLTVKAHFHPVSWGETESLEV